MLDASINLSIRSAGYEDLNFRGISTIIAVDKENIGVHKRGFNIAVLDGFTGLTKDFKVFDPCGDESESDNLVKFLDSHFNEHDIIVIIVNDEALALAGLKTSVRDKIASLGSKEINKLCNRCPWILVTRKNGNLIKEILGTANGNVSLEETIKLSDVTLATDAELLIKKAEQYYSGKQFNKAIQFFEKAITLKPNSFESHHNLGDCYKELKQYNEAAKAYELAIKLKPNSFESHHNLGDCYRELKQYNQSIESYKRAIELKPADIFTGHNLGSSYSQQKQQTNSITHFSSVVSNTAFDSANSGRWDNKIKLHPITQIPLFTYRVYKEKQEVGSAVFYSEPFLCRSSEGDRHNIVESTGILCDVVRNINPENIETVCSALPPTFLESTFNTSIRSALLGAWRGSSQITEKILRLNGYSENTAQILRNITYYGGLYTAFFIKNAANHSIMECALQSAIETGNLLAIDIALQVSSTLCQKIAHGTRMETAAKYLNNYILPASLFCYQHQAYAYHKKIEQATLAAISIATGATAQIVVETIGEKAVKRFSHSATPPFAVHDQSGQKSWHFDPATERKASHETNAPYQILEATAKDKQNVVGFYQHHPVPGYEIASVKIIYNRDFNQGFEIQMKKLQKRHNNPAFAPKWLNENNPQWRQITHGQFENLSNPYTDPDYPQVKLLPLWHGTKPEILDSIFSAGYANLAINDNGFFGRGIYGAYEAEYPHRVYSKGALILNWVATFSAYPTIHGDMPKLQEKGNYQNYDTHFVPVVPANPLNPNEVNYFPCKPNQKNIYTEVVVFESSSCLPRYLVELQASGPQANKLNLQAPPQNLQKENSILFSEDQKNWGRLNNRAISKYVFCFFDTKNLKTASLASKNYSNICKEIENERRECKNFSMS